MQSQNEIHSLNLFDIYDQNPYLYKVCLASWKQWCPNKKVVIHTEKDEDLSKAIMENVTLQNTKMAYGEDSYEYKVLCSLFAKLFVFINYGGWFIESDIMLRSSLPMVDSNYSHLVVWSGPVLSSSQPIFINKEDLFLQDILQTFNSDGSFDEKFSLLDTKQLDINRESIKSVVDLKIKFYHFSKISALQCIDNKVKIWLKFYYDKISFAFKFLDMSDNNIHYCDIARVAMDPEIGKSFQDINEMVLWYKFIVWHFKYNLKVDYIQFIEVAEPLKAYADAYCTFGTFDDNFLKIEEFLSQNT